MFTEQDIKQIKGLGLDLEQVLQQIENFKKGFPEVKIKRPATLNDGIVFLNEQEKKKYINIYEEFRSKKKIVKFVPASGAATRMFRSLYSFLTLYYGNKNGYASFMSQGGLKDIMDLMCKIEKFPFYDELKELFKAHGQDIQTMLKLMQYNEIIEGILTEKGLNYGNLPKGLIKFHKYHDCTRTAAEEHLVEAAGYCICLGQKVFIHFTVSKEHLELFENHIKNIKSVYIKKYDIDYNIDFSIQQDSTRMIAVDMDNNPVRDKNGVLLFRPGGHGALLENLNTINADIIFIKNIDNVALDKMKEISYKYKKVLGGLLLFYKKKIDNYLNLLENRKYNLTVLEQKEILHFLKHDLKIEYSDTIIGDNRKLCTDFIYRKLNRPLRICGIVKNRGEAGGGPFWVENSDGTVSLQIVEMAQINLNNPFQAEALKNSTHFNPTDIVCCPIDHRGKKYDLKQYIDPMAGIITQKSYNGKDIKAQELPGLWNGSMADWNTIFVEVPFETFTPVKTYIDLLQPEHQELI